MNVTTDPRKPRSSAPPPVRRRSRLWIWVVITIVVALAVFAVVRHRQTLAAEGPGTFGPPRGGRGAGPGGGGRHGPSVVTAVAVKQGDLPDYITALGTVTPLNTAIVHSRVDGQIVKINFEEGQTVKAGDVLAEIDARPFQVALQQAQGQLARDQATLDNARRDFKRYQEAREAVTQQQIDAAQATVEQSEGLIKADEGAVASAQLQLGFCQVIAPIDGLVGLRQVDVGNLVHASDTNGVAVITQIQPIAVRFSVPEDNLPSVMKSMATGEPLQADIFDRSMSARIAGGKLAAIDNQIDTTTGTLRIKAVVPNDDRALFPNQFVNVRLLVNIEKGVLLAPTSSIQINGQDNFVYVVGSDSTVHRTAVKTGNTEGLDTVMLSGVNVGDKVVTEGLDRLEDGATVTIRVPGDTTPLPAPNPNAKYKGGHKRRTSSGS